MAEALRVGAKIPPIELQSADGSGFALDALGGPVLLFGMRAFT